MTPRRFVQISRALVATGHGQAMLSTAAVADDGSAWEMQPSQFTGGPWTWVRLPNLPPRDESEVL